MDRDELREALLAVMERKRHWAWPLFTSGQVAKERLHIHLEHEYAVYIRDFAVLLGRAYVQCPIAAARRELAENLFEEETGKLSGGRPHADMFLEYPRGLGMDLARFDDVELMPAALAYREAIDDATSSLGWDVAAAITTIFLEGTEYERGELDANAPKRPTPPLSEHPLVKHYGLPLEHLELVRAHRMVEGDHRRAAWTVVLEHVAEPRREVVVAAMERLLGLWLAYRDEVAIACGLTKPS
jgi:pyrroloquinoline quinone (PQQ) biosynthesis protein C